MLIKVLQRIRRYGKLIPTKPPKLMDSKVDVDNAEHSKYLQHQKISIFMMKLHFIPIHQTLQLEDHQLLNLLSCHGKFLKAAKDVMIIRREVEIIMASSDASYQNAQLDKVYIDKVINKVNVIDALTIKLVMEEFALIRLVK